MILSKGKLYLLYEDWVEESCINPGVVLAKAEQDIRSLLLHINAQDEALARLQAVAETAMGCDKALAAWVNVRVAEASADHSAEALAATHLAYKQLLDKGIATREALAALDAKEASDESDDGS